MSAGGNVQYLPLLSKAFETYYTTYPEDDKAVFAYYYDAWARYRLGSWRDASNTFRRLAKAYPRSKYAPEALFRSGEAVFNLAQGLGSTEKEAIFAEAMANYDEVVGRYPNSSAAIPNSRPLSPGNDSLARGVLQQDLDSGAEVGYDHPLWIFAIAYFDLFA